DGPFKLQIAAFVLVGVCVGQQLCRFFGLFGDFRSALLQLLEKALSTLDDIFLLAVFFVVLWSGRLRLARKEFSKHIDSNFEFLSGIVFLSNVYAFTQGGLDKTMTAICAAR